eukprot:EG_transcript_11402
MAPKGQSSSRDHVPLTVRSHPPRAGGAPLLNVTLPAPLAALRPGAAQPGGPHPPAAALWHDASVLQRARQLGINPAADPDLMWIAKEALETPLPAGWSQRMDDGQVYFVNDQTGEGSAEHPLNAYFRAMLYKHKLRKAQSAPATTARPIYDLNESQRSHLSSVSITQLPGSQAHPNGGPILFASPHVPRGPPVIHGAEIKIIAAKPSPLEGKVSGARSPVTIPLSCSPSPSSIRLTATPAPVTVPTPAAARKAKKGRSSRRRSASSSSSSSGPSPKASPVRRGPPPPGDAVEDLRAQVRELQAQLWEQQQLLRQQLLATDDRPSRAGFPTQGPGHSPRVPYSAGPATGAVADGGGRATAGSPPGAVEAGHLTLDPAAFLLRHGVDPSGLSPAHLAALSLYTASVVERCVAEYAAQYEAHNFWRTLTPPHELVERRIAALEETLARLEAGRSDEWPAPAAPPAAAVEEARRNPQP